VCVRLRGGSEAHAGDIVWAKFEADPWWPAKIAPAEESGEWCKKAERTCRVVFYGEDTEAWVPFSKLKPFDKDNFEMHASGDDSDEFLAGLDEAAGAAGCADLLAAKQKKEEEAAEAAAAAAAAAASTRSRRPTRMTAQRRQAAQAGEYFKASRRGRKRLKGPAAKVDRGAEDDEDDDDLGLSDDDGSSSAEEQDDGSESEYEGSGDDEAGDDDEVSEGEPEEPEDEDAGAASSEEEDEEEEEEERAPRKRKRQRPPAAKKAAAAAAGSSGARRSSGDALDQFACTAAAPSRSSTGRAPSRGGSSPAVSPSSPPKDRGAPLAGHPEKSVIKSQLPVHPAVDPAADSTGWKAIAATGDWPKARAVRFQQWTCAMTHQDFQAA
jgi:hypothetical protein